MPSKSGFLTLLPLLLCIPQTTSSERNISLTQDGLKETICPSTCSCYQPHQAFDDVTVLPRILENAEHRKVNALVYTSCVRIIEMHALSDLEVCTIQNLSGLLLKRLNHIAALNPYKTTQIQLLCLSNKTLSSLDQSLFHRYQNINALTLSNNKFSNITWIEKASNLSLYYLDLSYNRIQSLGNGNFKNLPQLAWLDVSFNSIGVIDPGAFRALSQLQLLDLSGNLLPPSGLGEGSFQELHELVSLSLANNCDMNHLPNFKLSGLDQTKLESLDLHGLHFLTNVGPQAFQSLQHLKLLNLSFCSIHELEAGWINNGPEKTLQTLDLSHNFLRSIKPNYFVSFLLGDYWDQYSLKAPDFDLNSLPYIISPTPGKSSSMLPFAKYREFLFQQSQRSEYYQVLPNLTWLSVSDNPFLQVLDDDAFNLLPSLQYLFLQKCNISKAQVASTANRFENDAIKRTFPALQGLWMWGNPFQCDCHVRNLRDFYNYATESACFNQSNEDVVFMMKADEYWYKERCRNVENVDVTWCFLKQDGHKIAIEEVPNPYLYCPDEPVSMFVVMLIGPITFAISIAIMTFCGYCAVVASRFKREKSGFYGIQAFQLRNQAEENFRKSKTKTKKTNFNYTYRPNPSPRLNYSTNLVLRKMGTPRTPRLQTRILPSYLLNPRSRSRSPALSPRLRTNRESKSSSRTPSFAGSEAESIQLMDIKAARSLTPDLSKKKNKSLLSVPRVTKSGKQKLEGKTFGDTKPFLFHQDKEETKFAISGSRRK